MTRAVVEPGEGWRKERGAMVAALLFMVFIGGGFLLMPMLMRAIAAAGFGVGVAVTIAVLFLLAPFAALWLRGRWQQRRNERI